jgi:hypothetical protein
VTLMTELPCVFDSAGNTPDPETYAPMTHV